jgi:3-hydroxybutyryl-CoA dehydratase
MRNDHTLGAAFDDLAPGALFTTRGRTITEADLVSFAALTGDWHPQHADAAWAAGSRFGARVAHGMLILSYAIGLVPFDAERVVALRGLDGVSFKRPVRIGDTVRVEGRVESTQPLDDDLGLVTFAWRVLNQEDKMVARARVRAMWRRDNGAARAAESPDAVADFEEVYL